MALTPDLQRWNEQMLDCPAGQYPRGVDAHGNHQGCALPPEIMIDTRPFTTGRMIQAEGSPCPTGATWPDVGMAAVIVIGVIGLVCVLKK